MKTFQDFLSASKDTIRGAVVVLGTFDGVHAGHQALLSAAVRWACPRGKQVLVVTFSPSPAAVLFPERATSPLIGLARRLELFADLGIDATIVQRFDREFAQIAPEEFIRCHLFDALDPAAIFVGQNFTFGRGGSGTSQLLQCHCTERGIPFTAAPLIQLDGITVSSTQIRQRLSTGDVQGASMLLGRPYCLEGEVVHGRARGRLMGFPTANIDVSGLFLPLGGVYAARAYLGEQRSDQRWFSAVLNLGSKPTFGESDVTAEAFLLDAAFDLYGQRLRLELVAHLRAEKAFEGPDQLRAQIQRDCAEAKARLMAGDLVAKNGRDADLNLHSAQ